MAKKKTYDFTKPIPKRNLSSEYMYKYIEKYGTEKDLDDFVVASFDENKKLSLASAREFFIERYPNMVVKEERKKKAVTTIDIMKERLERILAEKEG